MYHHHHHRHFFPCPLPTQYRQTPHELPYPYHAHYHQYLLLEYHSLLLHVAIIPTVHHPKIQVMNCRYRYHYHYHCNHPMMIAQGPKMRLFLHPWCLCHYHQELSSFCGSWLAVDFIGSCVWCCGGSCVQYYRMWQ